MKTREKNVIVEITDNGRVRRRSYPIADENGNLMTNRLRRLIAGKLGHSYNGLMDELRISKGVLTVDQMMHVPRMGSTIILR